MHKRCRLSVSLAAMAFAASAAAAADLGGSEAPFDWSGAYIGIVGGGSLLASSGSGGSFFDINDPPSANAVWNETYKSASDWAPTLGGQMGYNWQNDGNLVFGLVGDLSWTGNSESDGTLFFGGYSFHREDEMDMFGTLRGKMGHASGNTLFSASAGLALGHFDTKHQTVVCCPTLYEANFDGWAAGLVLGAGIDHAVGENMIIRARAKSS